MAGFDAKTKTHRLLSTFVDWVAPAPETEEAIRSQGEEVRARFRARAAEDGLVVRSTPNGGSFAKRTGLRRHMLGDAEVEGQDVDVPFVISPTTKDDAKVDRLLDRFESYAKASYPQTPRKRTKCSVKLDFVASKLSFELVPMLGTDVRDEQILFRDDGERRTSVQKNIEFVASRSRSSNELPGRVKFNECVRLMKWWRDFRATKASSLLTIPSFTLELLAAKAYDTLSVKTTYGETLAAWFALLADIVSKRAPVCFADFSTTPVPATGVWQVLDPVNQANNAVAKWPGYHIDELAEWFATGRDSWARALAADLRGDQVGALAALSDIFGSPIRHRAGGI